MSGDASRKIRIDLERAYTLRSLRDSPLRLKYPLTAKDAKEKRAESAKTFLIRVT